MNSIQFHNQLDAFSKSNIFTGYLIVNKNGQLDQTNLIDSLWEKLKGVFKFQDRTNKTLVELKTIEFLLNGKNLIKTPHEIKQVQALARKVGLMQTGNDHPELHELVDEISTPSFSSPTRSNPSLEKAETSLLERFITNQHHQKDLSLFPDELAIIITTFNRVIQTPPQEEKSTTEDDSSFTSAEHSSQEPESEFSSDREDKKTVIKEDEELPPISSLLEEILPPFTQSPPSLEALSITSLPEEKTERRVEEQTERRVEVTNVKEIEDVSEVEILTPVKMKSSGWSTAAKVALVATVSFVALSASYLAWQYFKGPEESFEDVPRPLNPSENPNLLDTPNPLNFSNPITQGAEQISSYFTDKVVEYFTNGTSTLSGNASEIAANPFGFIPDEFTSTDVVQPPSIIDTITTTVQDAVHNISSNTSDFFTPINPFVPPIGNIYDENIAIETPISNPIFTPEPIPEPPQSSQIPPAPQSSQIPPGRIIETVYNLGMRTIGALTILGVTYSIFSSKKEAKENIDLKKSKKTAGAGDSVKYKKRNLADERLLGIPNFSGVACYQNAALKSLFNSPLFVELLKKPIPEQKVVKKDDETERAFHFRKVDIEDKHPKKEELRKALLELYDSLQVKLGDEVDAKSKQVSIIEKKAKEVSQIVFASNLHPEFHLDSQQAMHDSSAFIELFLDIFDYKLMEQVTNTGIDAEGAIVPAHTRILQPSSSFLIQLPLPPLEKVETTKEVKKNSLQSLISQKQTIEQDEDAWEYDTTTSYPTYQKKTILTGEAPNLLVVQLKRGNTLNGEIAVEDKQELELPKDGIFDFASTYDQQEPLKYEIKGFIYRYGDSGSGGHYITYLKEKSGWVCYDGSSGRSLKQKEAYEQMAKGYIFFFDKIQPVTTKSTNEAVDPLLSLDNPQQQALEDKPEKTKPPKASRPPKKQQPGRTSQKALKAKVFEMEPTPPSELVDNPLEGYDLQTELKKLKSDVSTSSRKQQRDYYKKIAIIEAKLDKLGLPHERPPEEDLNIGEPDEGHPKVPPSGPSSPLRIKDH